jgi:hypothetical protein
MSQLLVWYLQGRISATYSYTYMIQETFKIDTKCMFYINYELVPTQRTSSALILWLICQGRRKEGDKYLNLKSPRFKFSRCQNTSIAIFCIFCSTLAFVTTLSSCPIMSGWQTINLNVQLVTEVHNYQWHFTLNFWTFSSASLHFLIFSFYYIRDHMPADFIGP